MKNPKLKKKRVDWERIRSFFEDPMNKETVRVNSIERHSGVPHNMLSQALRGTKGFPEKHDKNVANLLERFGLEKLPEPPPEETTEEN